MKTLTRTEAGQSIRRACILHAEDDRLTAAAIARLLTIKGFSVDKAANGQEALAKFMAHPTAYDLIITDQTMPFLSGEEWVTQLRGNGFTGKVVVYAASLPDNVLCHLHELGVEKVVHKSESLQSLLDAIQESLERQ